MTPRQQYAYLQALGPYFSGLGCAKGGVCSFVSATGTGTNSIPQVLHTLSRWGEYAAIGVCVAGSDGTCIGAVKVAFLGDTASNLANATSPGDFAAHEGLSAAETVVAGGGGIIAASLGKAGALETVLPSSTLGQTMLKVHFTLPSAVTTVIAPRIDERVFPAPPPHHGHLGH
jgi:hypothetical protein